MRAITFRRVLRAPVGLLLILLMSAAAHAGAVLDHIRATAVLRVCIWDAYQGVTYRDPRTGKLSGIDIDLSDELARRMGVKLKYVNSNFAVLAENLEQGRCDIAMHAVGVTPERALRVRFTQPYMRSGFLAVTTATSQLVQRWDDIDRPGIRVAVQQGTLMERAMAADLKLATLVVVSSAATREQELQAGRVDVFISDYPYTRGLLARASWVRLVLPPVAVHETPYAYAVKPGDDEWLQWVEQFVVSIKADGSLRRAGRQAGLDAIIVAP